MQTWQCLPNCGACCHLDPRDRPDLEAYLTAEELQQYLSMVGEAGWCIHFDHTQRQCRIYETRPRFCRVTPDTFEQMYAVSPANFDRFAINCCCEQIRGVYGPQSKEMQRYSAEVQEETL